jgi:AraC-like DNA-binding protein
VIPIGLPHRHFSNGGVPHASKFESYRAHLSPIFDVERSTDGLRDDNARGDAYLVGDLWLFHTDFPARRYVRTTDRIRRDGVDFIVVNCYVSGAWRDLRRDQTRFGGESPLQIVDCARPFDLEMTRTEGYGAVLRRERIEDRLGDLDELDRPLPSSLAAFFKDYLQLLGQRAPALSPQMSRAVETATYDLFAACLRPSRDATERARPALQAAVTGRAKRYIRERLEDPALDPETISRDLGLSRRSLYRLFEPTGGVQRYIQNARLDRVYAILTSGDESQSIAGVASRFRFESKGAFWRAFRLRFGMTPGDVRREAGAPAPISHPDGVIGVSSMQPWIDHLRR